MGAPKGVSLVIEPLTPMESPVITTADDCVDAIKRIGRDNVEAMMDVAPPTVANESVFGLFRQAEGQDELYPYL